MSDLIMTEAMERSLEIDNDAFSTIGLEIGVEVRDELWEEDLPHCRALIHRAVLLSYVLGGFSSEASCVEITSISEAELSVVLSNDPDIQKLNLEYRGKGKPTNVLSFSTLDDPAEENLAHQRGVLSLGDIILSRETLICEAKTQSKRLEDHFTHLLVHGVLHLLGYDHLSEDEALEMESLEIEILSRLGIKNPYELDGDRLIEGAIDE
ncbi:rRNA maturation RNase YbeY [Kiloniella antarctica]|uniref:Endoribonuclease YbeY n=1 Tax=Kiloniella antarctica TaxID=1550907 RepID=A0ABW5BFB0_9PROT